jgi:hypothetical protein
MAAIYGRKALQLCAPKADPALQRITVRASTRHRQTKGTPLKLQQAVERHLFETDGHVKSNLTKIR